MIEVRYEGRLGNNLFQYCLGRILAEKKHYELKADPIPGFPGTCTAVHGCSFETPAVCLSGHKLDFNRLIHDKEPARIILEGLFQNYEYYRPF